MHQYSGEKREKRVICILVLLVFVVLYVAASSLRSALLYWCNPNEYAGVRVAKHPFEYVHSSGISCKRRGLIRVI